MADHRYSHNNSNHNLCFRYILGQNTKIQTSILCKCVAYIICNLGSSGYKLGICLIYVIFTWPTDKESRVAGKANKLVETGRTVYYTWVARITEHSWTIVNSIFFTAQTFCWIDASFAWIWARNASNCVVIAISTTWALVRSSIDHGTSRTVLKDRLAKHTRRILTQYCPVTIGITCQTYGWTTANKAWVDAIMALANGVRIVSFNTLSTNIFISTLLTVGKVTY